MKSIRLLTLSLATMTATSAIAQVETTVEVKTPEFDDASENKHKIVAERARELLQQVIRQPSFADKVQKAAYPGGRFFRNVKGVVTQPTAGEVLDIIKKGIERGSSGTVDNKIEIVLQPKPQPKGVVGSTRLGSNPVRTATWFMHQVAEKQDATSLARHLLHEWMHVAGFFHRGQGPNQKDVPYVIGDIVRDIAQNELKPRLVADKSNALNTYMEEDALAVFMLEEAGDDVDYYAPSDDAPLLANIKFLKDQAAKCRRLAQSVSGQTNRQTLLDMAQEFEERARRLENGQGT
jgi:hypothetical protein